jgi:hypothetical protein
MIFQREDLFNELIIEEQDFQLFSIFHDTPVREKRMNDSKFKILKRDMEFT